VSADVTTHENQPSAARTSAQERRRAAQRMWRFTSILVPLLFALLIVGVLAVASRLHLRQRNSLVVQPHHDDSPGRSDRVTNAASETDANSDESRSAANFAAIEFKLQQAALDMELAQARQALRHLEDVQTEWTKLLESTLHDSVGKRIAGNEELLLRFIALRRMSPPQATAPLLPDFAKKLSDVHAKAKSSDTDGNIVNGTRTEARRIEQDFVEGYRFFHRRVSHLHALRESAASLPAGDVELFAALSLRAAALANDLKSAADEAARELDASLEEELSQLKQQRDNAAALVTQLEAQLTRVANGESAEIQSDGQGAQPLPPREEYERELKLIRANLVAFTTPGYVQPESADKLVYRKAKQPISYSALQRIGALEDSEKGRAILLRVGGSKSATQQNDRPLGNFPRMNSVEQLRKDEDVKARVRNAQRLLKRYGSLMVEDGLLSP